MLGLIATFFILIGVTGLNLFYGSANIGIAELFDSAILWELRIPRTLTAMMAGAILAISGYVTQIIFRNPLATPYTLGVASSASLGAIVAMSFGLSWVYVSLSSFVTAFIGVAFLIVIYFRTRIHTNALLLLGVAINLFCGSAISIVQVSAAKFELATYLTWVMGSVSVVGLDIFWRLALVGLILMIFTFFNARNLSVLMIEGESSTTRGFSPRRLILSFLLLITITISILVSELGPIGFIGLVVPHLVGRLYRTNSKIQIIGNILLGAILLIFADYLNRVFLSSLGLPVGVVTTAFGAPMLMYILLKKN